jgi:branched-chain amino acid transport system ATP-binding protein
MKDLHDEGQTVVLVEQNARLALGVADRGYVIEWGNVVLEVTARSARQSKVQEACLGVS